MSSVLKDVLIKWPIKLKIKEQSIIYRAKSGWSGDPWNKAKRTKWKGRIAANKKIVAEEKKQELKMKRKKSKELKKSLKENKVNTRSNIRKKKLKLPYQSKTMYHLRKLEMENEDEDYWFLL